MSSPSYEDIQKARDTLREISYQHWIHDDFLTWKWWFLLVLAILPWFIWWRIADKTRLHELLLYGFFITLVASVLDNIGTDLLWWGYPDKLLQMFPPLFPADYTLVPLCCMIVYQLCSSWKSFLIAQTALGLFLAYVAEPVFIWLDFYKLNEWKLTYSFLFYIIAASLGRWIVVKTRARDYSSE